MSDAHHMGRLPKGADLIESLNKLCAELGYERGSVQLIGALERASLGYYRQDVQEYVSHQVEESVEILSGLGNISIKDGKPFVHLHLVLSDKDGKCTGGHAMPGCRIFAAEAVLTSLPGPALVRGLDKPTGLPLWKE